MRIYKNMLVIAVCMLYRELMYVCTYVGAVMQHYTQISRVPIIHKYRVATYIHVILYIHTIVYSGGSKVRKMITGLE